MNLTLVQRAQALAYDLLLASFEPDDETPGPGSPAWDRAVEQVAGHLLHLFHQHKHLLLGSGPPPQVAQLGLGAAAATRALLQRIAREVA
jgi:hypothetical protein